MNFEFATATRIVFGADTAAQAGNLCAAFGSKAYIFTGLTPGRFPKLVESLEKVGISYSCFPVNGEPTLELITAAVEQVRQSGSNLVIGFGGGSAIDAGKAAAALAVNPGEPLEYLEVVGRGRPLEVAPLPFVAIPTTAGTGAEVTRNAVIGVPEQGVKVSLRSPSMLPRLALVDPALTYELPPDTTASTGLDAMTQLIEPFISNRPNPMVDAICREGIQRAAWALPRAYENGTNTEARRDMSLAALFGGMALANSRLGAVHGFAGVLGATLNAPHGALCARLLPKVLRANINAIRDREPHHPALQRFIELARLLTGRPDATIEAGLGWMDELVESFQIPALHTYGLQASDIGSILPKARRASSMQGNPIVLTDAELRNILEQAL